jgi:hypothetical protein
MTIYLFPFGVFALLAMLSQFNLVRPGRLAYALGVLWIGLFAGLRFETGQDWPAYEDYFNDLGEFDPLGSKFEVGYYLLNFGVKSLGGSYSAVFLISSLFCAYSVYRLTSRLAVNRFYILTVYMGYGFLVLNFAQVRQSLAVSFFLLGIDYCLRHPDKSKVPALALILAAPLFQISALMYIAILVPVLMWQSRNGWWWVVIGVGGAAMWTVVHFLDFYSILALVASASTQEKIAIYKEIQVDQSIFQVMYAGYLLLLALYFFIYLGNVDSGDRLVVRYAIAALALTVIFALALAGSYVFYSRAYAIACLFQGFAAAIVFASRKSGYLHNAVFSVSLVVACISYWRLLTFYADQYTPYHLIFESF